MKHLAWFILLAFFAVTACSEIDIDEGPLPDISMVTPQNLNTALPIYNISCDTHEYARMYNQYSKNWIVAATLSHYNSDNQLQFEGVSADIRIKGVSSARSSLKSIGFIFDTLFNNQLFNSVSNHNLMPHHNLEELYALRFRNSGNDFGNTMIKDLVYHRLAIASELNVELMYGSPCHVFINNEYEGLYNLRNENNLRGMAGLAGVDTGSISLMKIDVDNGNIEWDEGQTARAQLMEDAIKQEDEEAMWDLVDEANFIDYILFQDYIGNRDWPQNNCRLYSVGNAPFRFVLYDLDYAAFNSKNPLMPELEYRKDDVSKIFRMMLEKPGFKTRLDARQKVLYGIWSYPLFHHLVDEAVREIDDEIPYLMAKHKKPESKMDWKMRVEILKREFKTTDLNQRKKYDL